MQGNGESRARGLSLSRLMTIAVFVLLTMQYKQFFRMTRTTNLIFLDLYDTTFLPSSTESIRSNIDYYDYFINITTPQPQPTLVHYEPVFQGGFRNQHMRFVAFINFAVKNSITQVLLPSLTWSNREGTQAIGPGAPHEYLFDVPYWNERAEEFGLPRLVRYDPSILEGIHKTNANETHRIDNATIECFNTSSGLFSGLNETKLRNPNKRITGEKFILEIRELEAYSHCISWAYLRRKNDDGEQVVPGTKYTYLIPFGGDKLWAMYMSMQSQRYKNRTEAYMQHQIGTIHPDHHPVEKAMYSILRPSEPIRNAIQGAIRSSIQSTLKDKQPVTFVALHPRTEHDMLRHPYCADLKEKNLTIIFEHLRDLPRFDSLFIAINRDLALYAPPRNYMKEKLLKFADENANVLNHSLTYGLFGNESHPGIQIFESGIKTAEKVMFPEQVVTHKTGTVPRLVSADDLQITSIVASIVNFFTALEAEQFVGVETSTYSTDLFSARHYTGKGGNYMLNAKGMNEMHGPPPPFKC